MTYGMTNDVRIGGLASFEIEPFETVLVDELIPYVDAHFRTLSDQPHRAMAGLSMGGMETKTITLQAPRHVLPHRPFQRRHHHPGRRQQHARFQGEGQARFRELRQPRARRRAQHAAAAIRRRDADALKQAGINSVFYVSPDTAHEFLSWRRSLREFAPLLFRD